MANYFQANLVAYGDSAGLGIYEVGHFLQHQQYLNILASSNVILPDYNILHMRAVDENEFTSWLNAHETIHEFLRAHANVSGVDLGFLDPKSPESWEIWQEAHRAEHAKFDRHFGTT